MTVSILDNSLQIEVFIDQQDTEFDDDVCFRITENCAEEEKILYAGETNIYLTRVQARQFAEEILRAIHE